MTWLTWSLLSALFATAVRTCIVLVFTWLLVYLARQPSAFQSFSRKTWLFLILSGLATGLSWLCYFHALQVGPASRVAPIDKLSVALVSRTRVQRIRRLADLRHADGCHSVNYSIANNCRIFFLACMITARPRPVVRYAL